MKGSEVLMKATIDFKTIVSEKEFTFKHLVLEILVILAGKLGEVLAILLRGLDEVICFKAKRSGELKGWESIGSRERTLTTVFGVEIRYRRRGYRKRGLEGYEYRYPLDELLGIKGEERFCPLVQQIAVELATKMSFREAAHFMQQYLLVPVSHQEIHKWLQEAGKARIQEEEEVRRAIFENGEVPDGEKEAELVVVEVDGVVISLQRSQQKRAEIKLGALHEGWEPETPAQKRFRLKEKDCWGGILEENVFWEYGVSHYYSRYREVGKVVVNGDGAGWVKAAREYLPGAEIYLDPFHRNRALNENLSFAPELLQKAYDCLSEADLVGLEGVLNEALTRASSERQREGVRRLKKYLGGGYNILDWRKAGEELPDIPYLGGLGASESQINHVIAVRMKKRGMSWTVDGANNMTQLRCLGATDKLKGWLDAYQQKKWPKVKSEGIGEIEERILEPLRREDPAAWLQASVPLLATKAQASPLGEALKALAGIPFVAA